MQQKSTPISILHKNNNTLLSFFYKGRIIIVFILSSLLLIPGTGCKKLAAAAGSQSALESLFKENILNRDFVVQLATDNGTDLTNQFAGYNFVLTNTTSFYNGPMTGTKAGVVYTGTWISNEDFSQLVINITSPSTPPEFNFINRAWKFTKKAFPVMELAPWGSTEARVLHMQRL